MSTPLKAMQGDVAQWQRVCFALSPSHNRLASARLQKAWGSNPHFSIFLPYPRVRAFYHTLSASRNSTGHTLFPARP